MIIAILTIILAFAVPIVAIISGTYLLSTLSPILIALVLSLIIFKILQ